MTDYDDEGSRQKGDALSAPVLARILAEQAIHGRLLHAILELLTASRDDDGPSLSRLIESLVAAIGEQTRALAHLSTAVAKFGRDLPLDLVAAIDDNLDIPRRAQNGTDGSIPS